MSRRAGNHVFDLCLVSQLDQHIVVAGGNHRAVAAPLNLRNHAHKEMEVGWVHHVEEEGTLHSQSLGRWQGGQPF